ncbi:FtsK/SpoIIIE domain-containing protein [Nakamurella sp.]|uniref:FtsK/SpoIIIE domain-containing protein n=1 Tax=Nakamurella sp. TaxID=1869182 RepID=UPI00378325CE
MRLKFSFARAGGATVDLVATADATVTVGDLAAALDRCDPDREFRAGPDPGARPASRLTLRVHSGSSPTGPSAVLSADLPLSVSGLRSGSLVTLAAVSDRFVGSRDHRGTAAATLSVLSGPDAGQEFPLAEGTSVIGRDAGCDVRLTDPLVSKRHARITVGDAAEIVDTGSANGLIIGGAQVPRAVVRPHDRIILGETAIGITVHRTAAAALAQTADVDFNRSPRLDPTFPGEEFQAPDPPEKPQRQRFPLIASLAPLVMGAVLFAFTRSALSIVFVALSPLFMIGNWVDNRIQNRRLVRDGDREFAAAVHQLREEIATALARERVGRLAECPSTAEVVDAMRRQTPLLWTRRREHERMLTIRLGVGTQPSRHTVELPNRSRTQPRHWLALAAVRDAAAEVPGVPVVGDLRDSGSIGVAGPRAAAVGVGRGLVAQLAGLHSPADLTVVAFVSADTIGDWGWLKWLPHNGSAFSPVTGPQLAGEAAAGLRLVAELEELIIRRTAVSAADTDAPPWPAVVAVIEDAAPVERSRLVGLAESGPLAGVHVLWIAGGQERLPAACRTFLAVADGSGTVAAGFVRAGAQIAPVVCETLDGPTASAAARALAPVGDAGVRIEDDSDLPRSVSFLALVGADLAADPAAVLERWRESESIVRRGGEKPTRRRNLGLRAVVGQSAGESLTLDLRSQGPHALVGGTTGAGKSEFLQSWVLGMAAGYSPDTLTFLFVDYKGGAAFAECISLPHSVGMVTDLSPHLVRRALTSLNAELRHREHILNAKKVKDLLELQRRGDPDAPPSLVIVVDEFAALVQEVPEFVDGVVNVAQRGRSLGLHLILATQRPAGVIKDNLRANTNLRIALRMADAADSTDVLGSPLAADFSPDIPGRGAAKTGPGRITGFQTGYVGGWTGRGEERVQLDLHELTFGAGRAWEEPAEVSAAGGAESGAELGPTDIARLVGTVSEAARRAEIPEPRRPWLPELAGTYDLQFLRQRTDHELILGVLDDPGRQEQRSVAFQPDVDGNLAVYGTGGAGKSTLLRTLGIAAGITPRSGPCHVYGLDFGSAGLRMLEPLPHVGSIISGDDTERVVRLIRFLRELVEERAVRYAAARAGTITEYRQITGRADEPRVLVLLDGLAGFRAEYEFAGRANHFGSLTQVAADGRPVGVHLVVSADRPATVPAALGSTIQRRVVLRLADDNDYLMLDTGTDVLDASSPPGRGVLDGKDLQVAVFGGAANVAEQARAIDRLAGTLRSRGTAPVPEIRRLPEVVHAGDLAAAVAAASRTGTPGQPGGLAGRLVIGLADDTLGPVAIEPSGVFLLAGPPGSGRTTCLGALATAAVRRRPNADRYYLGNRRSPLAATLPGRLGWTDAADSPERVAELAGKLASSLAAAPPTLVVIEGLTDFLSGPAEMALQELVKVVKAGDHLLLADSETSTLTSSWPLVQSVRSARRGLALQPDQTEGDAIFRTSFPRITRAEFPPGRGLLVEGGKTRKVQIALPD